MSEIPGDCEVLVIGSGPAGCTAALYAARAGLQTVISSPTELSGMMAKAPLVANFPAQKEPTPGREILARIREQALAAGARHVLETVNGVDFSDPPKLLVYGGHDTYQPRAVIVATGAMSRAGKAPGEEEYAGRGVSYCAACDGPFYSDEDVLVVGEDQQAAEEALTLANIARSVCLVSPIPELRIDSEAREALNSRDNITIEPGLKLNRIIGEAAVTGAVFNTLHGEERTLPGTGVFLYLRGVAPATEFLRGCLELNEKGFIITDDLCLSSVPGVYAAGDVRAKEVRQMIVAAAEGCIAALAAERFIRGRGAMRIDRGMATGG